MQNSVAVFFHHPPSPSHCLPSVCKDEIPFNVHTSEGDNKQERNDGLDVKYVRPWIDLPLLRFTGPQPVNEC